MYTRDEVYKETLKYFKGNEFRTTIWIDKYCMKDSDNNYFELSPTDMHYRLAKELARIEAKYPNGLSETEIFETIKDFKYIVPQGSPMAGIGNDLQVSSISNCFVIGDESDSYGGVFTSDQEQAQLMKRRGGVGKDLSHIRPKGSKVNNSALTSTGIVPFMERYSNTTREVAQDGRRGALMLSCSVNHPDVIDFLSAKLDTTKITGANISVKIDDDFMLALKNNTKYTQKFPIYSENPTVTKEIDPHEIWDKLVFNNWKCAEPGILYWDTILRESIADCYADLGFKTISTNPCGEITLCDADSCRLLVLNLFSYVIEPFTKNARFDFDLFKKHVKIAQRYMDDIVDLELEKIDKILEKIETDPESDEIKLIEKSLWLRIKDKCIKGRRTGTGVTAEGDMLAALGLTYGTPEATAFAIEVHKTLAVNAFLESTNLAKERGAFPIFDMEREENNPFVNRLYEISPKLKEATIKYGRRNIALLTISPTGTVSIMTDTTSGIEPLFLPFYSRRRKINPENKIGKVAYVDNVGDSWEQYTVLHKNFKLWAEINGYVDVENYSNAKLTEIFKLSPYFNACSADVNWKESIIMQGGINKFVDHSISKTTNIPNNATVELVDLIYKTAHECGCKGCTIYRDGSREGVLISSEEKEKEKETVETDIKKRPKTLKSTIIRFNNNKEKWVAIVSTLDDKPYEIFTGVLDEFNIPQHIDYGTTTKNSTIVDDVKIKSYDFEYKEKDGTTHIIKNINKIFRKEYWNYAKLISSMLRYKIPLVDTTHIISTLTFDDDNINIWKNGVVRALKRFVKDGTHGGNCPKCKVGKLIFQDGCMICPNCGDTKCG